MTNFSGAWPRPDVVVGGLAGGLVASNDQWLVWSPPDGTQGGHFGGRMERKKDKERKEVRMDEKEKVASQGWQSWSVWVWTVDTTE